MVSVATSEDKVGDDLGLTIRQISALEGLRMAYTDVEKHIRSEKGSKDSIEDMIAVTHGFWEENILPNHEGVRRKQVETLLGIDPEYTLKTSLKHLTKIDILKTDPEDADDLRTFAVAPWRGADGDIVNGESQEAAEEAIEVLIAHMRASEGGTSPAVADGGVTIRSVLAEHFSIVPEAVENRLRSGDPVNTIRSAVFAIRDHPEVETRDDYGPIVFRNEAYRYTLTERAVTLYER